MARVQVDHDAALQAERRDAARLLLTHPLVTATGDHAETFELIRRHADWLVAQFGQMFGYRLVVQADFARLYKAGLGPGAGHRLLRPGGAPFTPRTYAYLALTVAVLVTAPEQMLLSQVVTGVRAAAAEAGLRVDEPDSAAERRALAAALRQLVAWEVLSETEGSVGAYADDAGAEALVTVNREVARHLVAGPLAQAADADDLVRRAESSGHGGARVSVRRRLAEAPVTYLDDLTEAERGWLRANQRREARTFSELLDLVAEVRAEGVALLDRRDELSDTRFPDTGTVAQAALLLLDELVERLRPADAGTPAAGGRLVIGVPIPAGLVGEILADLCARHAGHWSGAYLEDRSRLQRDVTDLLARMRLVAPAGRTRADLTRGTDTAGPTLATGVQESDGRRVTDVRDARGQQTAAAGLVLLAAAARYRSQVVMPDRSQVVMPDRSRPVREQER
ncbi:MAG TPA: TIGR02678 family protein [Actinomycetes bacterium]|jgi:uncharacterized protein (TIGR02678 family)|nr:TIGR02678 family protein [Actinomycetes bacterium]